MGGTHREAVQLIDADDVAAEERRQQREGDGGALGLRLVEKETLGILVAVEIIRGLVCAIPILVGCSSAENPDKLLGAPGGAGSTGGAAAGQTVAVGGIPLARRRSRRC